MNSAALVQSDVFETENEKRYLLRYFTACTYTYTHSHMANASCGFLRKWTHENIFFFPFHLIALNLPSSFTLVQNAA